MPQPNGKEFAAVGKKQESICCSGNTGCGELVRMDGPNFVKKRL